MIGQDEAAELVALGEFVEILQRRLDAASAREIARRADLRIYDDGDRADPWRLRLELRLARAALARAALPLVAPLRELTCPDRVEAARERIRSGQILGVLDM